MWGQSDFGPDFSCFEMYKNQIRLPESGLQTEIPNIWEARGTFSME